MTTRGRNAQQLPAANYHVTAGMPEWNRNPFISALGEYRDDLGLKNAMSRDPFSGYNLSDLPPHLCDAVRDKLIDEAFVVTTNALYVARNLQRMLFTGLRRRDPSRRDVWRRLYETGALKGKNVVEMPWSSEWADGLSVLALTGMGKTHLIARFLQLYPQVIRHSRFPGMPWHRQTQLVWLHVDMSFDGTLGGLVLAMASALDAALGTEYKKQCVARGMSVQKAQVIVIDALAQHFLGLLWIDELQRINMAGAHNPDQIATFFLRLLNAGIPVVLSGAPNGFSALDSYAQVLARAKSGGQLTMYPYSLSDDEWRQIYVPGVWARSATARHTVLDEQIRSTLDQCSGGIPRYLNQAVIHAEEIQLATGEGNITADMIADGFRADRDERMHEIINAIANRNPLPLFMYPDVPAWDLARQWGINASDLLFELDPTLAGQVKAQVEQGAIRAPEKNAVIEKQSAKSVMDYFSKEKAKAEKNRNRQTLSKKKQAVELPEGFSPGDIRVSGYADHMADAYINLHGTTP